MDRYSPYIEYEKGPNGRWYFDEDVDTRIQELEDENKLLKNKDALAQVCIDIKTDNDILRKALEEIETLSTIECEKMAKIATEALKDT